MGGGGAYLLITPEFSRFIFGEGDAVVVEHTLLMVWKEPLNVGVVGFELPIVLRPAVYLID